jgi:hypothetical protein
MQNLGYCDYQFLYCLKSDNVVENSFKNLYCDELHMKAFKYILGLVKIVTQSTKYFIRLLYSKPTSLIYSAFQENLTLHANNKNSWVSYGILFRPQNFASNHAMIIASKGRNFVLNFACITFC